MVRCRATRPLVALAIVVLFSGAARPAAAGPTAGPRAGPIRPVLPARGRTARAHFTHGWITATVYFDRRETTDATLASGAIPACLMLAAHAGPAAPFLGAACAAHATAVWIQANRAQSRHMCLKVKLTWPPSVVPLVIWPDIYGGGYCR
ncbi:MAG: hypothetical protein JWN46_49 [Acidimicrobiales bacterium]|nr:hypothetical protein [Acidimicrobiales bacterium]